MPIHEEHLIRPENLSTHDSLVVDGVDVSGHWSTFIRDPRGQRTTTRTMQEEIEALPGGENIHRCWQCGSCTNACTVQRRSTRDFNPRYWIYLIRMGMESELAARQGHHLAVRELQQVHLRLPARRGARRRS